METQKCIVFINMLNTTSPKSATDSKPQQKSCVLAGQRTGGLGGYVRRSPTESQRPGDRAIGDWSDLQPFL
jgi:hypothetical protein